VIPSQQLLQSLTTKHNADPETVHVIPHGIKASDHNSGVEAEGLPAASKGKTVVGFFGRLSPEKGPDLFVEIARKLKLTEEFFFVMTGDGPERQKVLEQIHRNGLENRIYAPGFVPDVSPLMQATDIVVLPSRLDGMPLVVLEAQALGKPVVASKVGSLAEMISHAETGFLCDPADVAGFCDRILMLARDPSLRDRVGAAARQSVLANYGAERMLEAYQRVFQAVQCNSRLRGKTVPPKSLSVTVR
jgi:glycosyltransferase involved in cell wall biosynthesis